MAFDVQLRKVSANPYPDEFPWQSAGLVIVERTRISHVAGGQVTLRREALQYLRAHPAAVLLAPWPGKYAHDVLHIDDLDMAEEYMR